MTLTAAHANRFIRVEMTTNVMNFLGFVRQKKTPAGGLRDRFQLLAWSSI